MHVDTWMFRTLNQNTHVYVSLLSAQPGREAVWPYKHGPGAVRATLVAKRIESIGAHTKPDVPWIGPELREVDVQCVPLASVRRVCQDLALMRIICGLLPIRVPSHELCFLRVYEIPLQAGSDRKVPYHFLRYFLVPSLISSLATHRTCGSLRVLVPIKCGIIDAGVVLNVRHVHRAHDFLGLLDISWTRVALGKTFLPEAHAFVEAYVGPFADRKSVV